MPKSLLKIGSRPALLALFALGIFAVGAARASVAPAPQYLYFNADCTDCALAANTDAYNVVATLELDGYIYGDPLYNGSWLENGNVVSFSYSGSNLVSPFHTLAVRAGQKFPPGGINSISGQINTGQDWPAPTNGTLDIVWAGDYRFTISIDGDWAYFAGSDLPNDYGHGAWSLTAGSIGPQTQQIPEPGSLLLVGLSLAGLALTRAWGKSRQGKSRSDLPSYYCVPLALMAAGIVQAAPGKTSDDLYIYGTPNGCLVQLKTPLKANEHVQWNGDCSNEFASGNGVLLVLDNSGKTNSALWMTMRNGIQSGSAVPVSNPSTYQANEGGFKRTAQPAAASTKGNQSGSTASNCPATFSGDQTYAGPWIWRRTDGTTATLISPHGNEYTSSSLQDLASGKVDMGAGYNQKTQLREWARCHLAVSKK